MPKKELADITVRFIRATDAAICVTEGSDLNKGVWLAKSLIEYEPKDPKRGAMIEVTLPTWLAAEKEFAGF